MKTKPIYLLILFLLMGIGCQKTTDVFIPETKPDLTLTKGILKNGVDCEVDLIAGQNYVIGTVSTQFNTETDELTIVYTITDPLWCLTEVHLDVQADPVNFPQTKKGNPKVGHFAYSDVLNCAPSWTQVVDLTSLDGWSEGDMIYIAAHATVLNSPDISESAWCNGTSFPGKNWAMYTCCEPPWKCGDPLLDERDGQEYSTVQIGDQCWMAENLSYLPTVNTPPNHSFTAPMYYVIDYYGTDVPSAKATSNYQTYGVLYNWPAAMISCPEGWSLPENSAWDKLAQHISNTYGPYSTYGNGSWSEVGYHLKTSSGWFNNGNGSDDVDYSGQPGGYMCSVLNDFNMLGEQGNWWSTQEYNSDFSWWRFMRYDSPDFGKWRIRKATSFSVRCIKE